MFSSLAKKPDGAQPSMSLFGAPQQQQQPQAQTTSLFGQPTQSLFGQQTQQQQQQQQQQQPTQSLFGQTLGQQQPQPQQQTTAFAQSQPLGQAQGNAFGQSRPQPLGSSLWQPGSLAPHQKSIPEQMQIVASKWDPTSPNCATKYYFYNKVDEAHIPYYQPQAHEDPKEWEEALKNKPAPGFMPVLGAGFRAMSERLKVQQRAIGTFNSKLHEINASLDAILSRHDLITSVNALAARRRHAEISRRCLILAAKVQVLRNRGYTMSGDEDDLKQKLQAIENSSNDPALSARMEELWSRLIVLRNYSDSLRNEINKKGAGDTQSLGEENEARAKQILEDYEKQLQHLKKEVGLIKSDFEAWEKDHHPAQPRQSR